MNNFRCYTPIVFSFIYLSMNVGIIQNYDC